VTQDPREVDIANRWTILGVLCLTRVVMGYQFQSVASASPFLIDDLGVSYAQIGTLIGLYMLPGAVIALPSGVLTARFGDRRTAGYGLALMGAGGAVMSIADNYSLLFVGRLTSGVGGVLFNVVITKMVTDWFAGREIRIGLGIMLTTWPTGIALGLLTQSALAEAYSWTWVMAATSGVSFLAMAALVSVYRPPPGHAAVQHSRPALFALPRRELIGASIAGMTWGVFNVGFALFFSFSPDLLADQGMSAAGAASLVSIGMWVTVFSVPLGGLLAERTGRPNAIAIVSAVASGTTLALMSVVDVPIAFVVAFGLGIGGAGAIMAMSAQALSPENRGPGLGLFYTWYYVAMAIGPAVAGKGRDITESAAAPVLIGASMFVFVIFLVAAFQVHQTRVSRTTPSTSR